MPDVMKFNNIININQILSSKIVMQSKTVNVYQTMGKILCNKQEKNQNKLFFDLNKRQLKH